MAPGIRRYPFLTSGQSYKLDRFLLTHPLAKAGSAVGIAVILIIGAYFIGKGFSSSDLEPFSMKEGPVRYVEKIERVPETIVKTVEVPAPAPPGRIQSFQGTDAHLVGGWGDNLQWGGMDVRPIPGTVTVKVDPDNNIGSVIADLPKVSINSEDRTYLDGHVRIEFTVFSAREDYQQGGLAKNIELFGNTGRESDLLPRVKADLAGWGTAEVLLDGESVYSKLPAFFMINEAIRSTDGSVSLADGTYYTQRMASTGGFADSRNKELTLMLFSTDVDKKNKPPVSVFIHLYFKDVMEGESIGTVKARNTSE